LRQFTAQERITSGVDHTFPGANSKNRTAIIFIAARGKRGFIASECFIGKVFDSSSAFLLKLEVLGVCAVVPNYLRLIPFAVLAPVDLWDL